MWLKKTKQTAGTRQKYLGLFTRKERWGLSWRGWLLLAVAGLLGTGGLMVTIHPFLAITQRENARYLVMEGWVHDFAAQVTTEEYRCGTYEKIFVTGLPVRGGSGNYTGDSRTEAYVGAGLLRQRGVAEEVLQRVPRQIVDRNRTYGSALELKKWFREHHLSVTAINIVTEGVHARRTRLLFEEAFGPQVKVGIIAAANPDYDARRWWQYSEGVREVLGETIAYLYARTIFHPPAEPQI